MSTIVTRSGKGSPLTHAEVDSNFTNLNTDKLELSGGTLTGTLNLGDNVKAQFGASADLQVYHDGTDSYIVDSGVGDLRIQANQFRVMNAAGTLNGLTYDPATGVTALYNIGNEKLATTSTGINVTGTVVADGAQIDLTGTRQLNAQIATSGSGYGAITCVEPSASNLRGLELEGQLLRFGTNAYNQTTSVRRMQINDAGEAIFYEDTGADAKMRWLPTNERLRFEDTVRATFGASDDLQIYHDGNNSYVSDQGQGVLYIQGSNNVQIESATGENMAVFLADNAVELYYDNTKKFQTTSTGIAVTGSVELNGWTITESGGSLYFATGGTNKMKLDASGNLDVVGSVNANATIT